MAYRALLAASCGAEISTEHIYLALITPSEAPDEHGEVVPHEGFAASPSGVVWRPTAAGMESGTLEPDRPRVAITVPCL